MGDTAKSRAKIRAAHMARRENVDGRLVATWTDKHGVSSTYTNYGCRCTPCTEAHSRYLRDQRGLRLAEREMIDGKMVAVNAPRHGTPSIYFNWGCRCTQCNDARKERR